MIGYGLGTTSYTILTEDSHVLVSRDVVFTGDKEHSVTRAISNNDERPISAEDNHDLEEGQDEPPERINRSSAPGPEAEPDHQYFEQEEEDLPIFKEPRRSQRLLGLQPEFTVPLDGAPEVAQLASGLEYAFSSQTLSNPQSYQDARNCGQWDMVPLEGCNG